MFTGFHSLSMLLGDSVTQPTHEIIEQVCTHICTCTVWQRSQSSFRSSAVVNNMALLVNMHIHVAVSVEGKLAGMSDVSYSTCTCMRACTYMVYDVCNVDITQCTVYMYRSHVLCTWHLLPVHGSVHIW